jgi:hypothetical protein
MQDSEMGSIQTMMCCRRHRREGVAVGAECTTLFTWLVWLVKAG